MTLIGILALYCIPLLIKLFGLTTAAFWIFVIVVGAGALTIVASAVFLVSAYKNKDEMRAYRATVILAYNSIGMLVCVLAADLLKII